MVLSKLKKRIAIGVSDFRKMLTGDYYYVDKTLFIKDIMQNWEEGLQLFERGIHKIIKLGIVFRGKEESQGLTILSLSPKQIPKSTLPFLPTCPF